MATLKVSAVVTFMNSLRALTKTHNRKKDSEPVTGQTASWNEMHEAAQKALLARKYEEAEELLAESYKLANKSAVHEDDLCEILEQLAEAYWYQSKLPHANGTLLELLAVSKKLREPVKRVVCLSNLAIVNHTLNNWKEAENYYLESLKEIRILLGPDHSYVTKYRSFYAELLNQQDRKQEAKDLGVQPREITEFDWQTSKVVSMIQERLNLPSQSYTALSSVTSIEMSRDEYEMVYQANAYRAKRAADDGDLKLSEKLWSFNLKMDERFGASDETLAAALDNIAGAQYQQGRINVAVESFEKALVLKKKALGRDDIAVGRSMHFLAGLFYELNDIEKSISHLRSSIRVYEKALGKEHATVASALHNLGTIYHVHHRYDLAEHAYQEALEIKYKIYGPDHNETSRLLKSYAELLAKTGRQEEAQKMSDDIDGVITGSWKGSAGNLKGICKICGTALNEENECVKCLILQ